MTFYLDANILIALLTPDELTTRAHGFLARQLETLAVSDLAAAEFASAICRRVRVRETTIEEARRDLLDFDIWVTRAARWIEIEGIDIAVATAFLRQLDLPLLTPDAIHIAIAQRLDATLVTFDRRMAASARTLGAAVAEP